MPSSRCRVKSYTGSVSVPSEVQELSSPSLNGMLDSETANTHNEAVLKSASNLHKETLEDLEVITVVPVDVDILDKHVHGNEDVVLDKDILEDVDILGELVHEILNILASDDVALGDVGFLGEAVHGHVHTLGLVVPEAANVLAEVVLGVEEERTLPEGVVLLVGKTTLLCLREETDPRCQNY